MTFVLFGYAIKIDRSVLFFGIFMLVDEHLDIMAGMNGLGEDTRISGLKLEYQAIPHEIIRWIRWHLP